MSNGRLISFTTSRGPAQGYLAGGESGSPDAAADSSAGARHPRKAGLIVIQEWWGLVPHIKDIVHRFAAEGFLALAPDLYHGKSTVDAEEASHLMDELDWARAVNEIAGAAQHLRTAEQCTHVGIVGYCMGGAVTMLVAASGAVDCYVSYYGFPPGAAAVATIAVPGRLYFGEHEDVFSLPDARAFVEAQRKKGIDTELVMYPDAGHAFFNDARPEVYKPEASADTWRRMLAFFGAQLKRP